MNKKNIILIIIGAIVLIALIAGIGVTSMGSPYDKQIQVAYKLLENGKYEEAILAFDKAIEIDAKLDKAYIGKADVYVARADDNAFEDIKAVMEIAYNQHHSDENIVNAIMRIADELMAKDLREWALEMLEFGYNLTNDERIKEHRAKLFDIFAGDFLAKLHEMFVAGDKEGVRREIQDEKYLEFVKKFDDSEYKYIYFPDKNSGQSGKGTALYAVDTKAYGKVFVYHGDYQSGKRNGTGTWVGANGIQYYWFEGQWSGDAPNGEGSIEIVKDESKIEKEPGASYGLKTEIKGGFKDGLYHGTINEVWHMDTGETHVWSPIPAVDGVYQKLDPIPAELADADYVQENYAEGEYLVAMDEANDFSDLWDSGEPHYVVGFKK